MTTSALHFEGVSVGWVQHMRALLLSAASLWSLWLAWTIAGRYASGARRVGAVMAMVPAIGIADFGWALLFWIW